MVGGDGAVDVPARLAPRPGGPCISDDPAGFDRGDLGGPGGEKCSTGSSELKGTQSYPLQFGAALAAEFKSYELGVASGDDPPASAGMTPGDMNADHMCDGDEELWSNPDWFLMDILSGQPDMWTD